MVENNIGIGKTSSEMKRNSPHQLETRLLPQERFKGEQQGIVIDLKKTGETLAVLRDVDGYSRGFIYDGRGNNVDIINLDPSSIDFASSTSKDYLYRDGRADGGYSEKISTTAKKIGYSEEIANRLEEAWKKSKKNGIFDNNNELSKDNVLLRPAFFLSAKMPGDEWNVRAIEDSEKNKLFLFSLRDTHFSCRPKPPFGKSAVGDEDALEALERSREQMSYGFKLDREETIFRISSKDGKELVCYSGNNAIVDPSNPDTLFFVNAGQVYRLDLKGVDAGTSRPELVSNLNILDPQELHLDPNGNFVVVRSKENKLIIYEKDTGEEVRSFDGVKGPILVDGQGDITFADIQNKLQVIETNFQAIPPGEGVHAKEMREEELKKLQEKFAGLDLDKVGRQKSEKISEDDVAQTLRENISKQVTEKVTSARKAEDVEDVLDRLQGLKADPANKDYASVIDEFVSQARDKLSSIRIVDLNVQLESYGKTLEAVKSVGDAIGLDEQFAKILDFRQKIDIADPDVRKEIEQKLQKLQTRKDTLNTQYQGELITVANQVLPQVEQLIRETGSSQELAYASTSGPAQQFERILINIKDPELSKQLRDKYNEAKTQQRNMLSERTREIQERDNQRFAQIVQEAKEDLATLREQIEKLTDTRQLDRFDKDPLVTAFKAKLFALPPELREIEEKRLEIILGARKQDIVHRKELGAVGDSGELKFGDVSFPVYKEPQRFWQPKLMPIKNSFWSDLIFEDSQGQIFHPGGDTEIVVEADLKSEQTKRIIESYSKSADEYFKGIKRKVPDFDEKWKITDFHMKKLEEIAEALNLQLNNHKGILLLQGEAGTGKNVLIDILGNLSNREVVQIACNENSVKEDLTYEFYYDPEKGTYKLPSRLIESLKRPGAIVLFDEINALKPGITKMLNSLFDYRRRIFLPEGGKERDILADPTVLFVGTMNPQNYAGVNRLSPEVKSRARVIDIEYPPLEIDGEKTRYKPDEAEMLAGYMETLGTLTQKEFRLCWDCVVNKDATNGADRILQANSVLEADIRRVYDVVRVANRLREMYEAYQIGDSNEPMDFPTSIREVVDIVLEMNHKKGVGEIIKRVIVPKIDDRRQKKIVDQTIDAVLGDTSTKRPKSKK
jgi:hypothetical protein